MRNFKLSLDWEEPVTVDIALRQLHDVYVRAVHTVEKTVDVKGIRRIKFEIEGENKGEG